MKNWYIGLCYFHTDKNILLAVIMYIHKKNSHLHVNRSEIRRIRFKCWIQAKIPHRLINPVLNSQIEAIQVCWLYSKST